ncbi:transposase [Caballeronia glathei]|nr:transposase [Caballeronia glathei]
MPALTEVACDELTGFFRLLVQRLMNHLAELDRQVREREAQIQSLHRSEINCRLASGPGIGPHAANALVASIGDAKGFANGRLLAAWLGLVPRQDPSCGENVLLGVSERDDPICERC